MFALGALLLLLAPGIAEADSCQCSPSQVYDPLVTPVFFFTGSVDSSSGGPCHSNLCTYIANATNGGVQQIKVLKFQGTATLKIYDGSAAGEPVFTLTSLPSDQTALNNFLSLNNFVTLVLDEGTDQNNKPSVIVALQYAADVRTTVPTTTTTSSPPTTSYHGSYKQNPASIALDLAIAFDQGADPTTLGKMKNLTDQFVSLLSITTDNSSMDATRLSLQALRAYKTDGLYGQPWKSFHNYEQYKASQDAIITVASPTLWGGALDAISLVGFQPGNNRINTESVYLILAQETPSDLDANQLKSKLQLLTDADVHTLVVYFNQNQENASVFTNLKATLKKFDYYFFNTSDPNAAQNFIDNVLINSDKQEILPNFGCAFQTIITPVSAVPATYTMPDTTYGEHSKYCNFQNTDLTFTAAELDKPCIDFTVKYDLEVEKDYLRFFASQNNGKEVEEVSLTGSDVDGTHFQIKAAKVRANFQTNANQVFQGFQIIVKNCN